MTSPRLGGGLGRLSPARRGGLIFIGAGILFVCTDAVTKSLVSTVPVVDVVWGRHISYLAVIVLLAGGRHPGQLFRTRRLAMQVARGVAMFGATATFFLSLSLLPLGVVSTLSSINPLIVIGLAGPLLHERITRPAVVGALVGFAGLLVLTGIDASAFDLRMLAPLGTAGSYAMFSLLTRELRDEDANVTVFYSGVVGLVLATVLVVAIPGRTTPEPIQWAGIALVGLMALTAHRILVAAYSWGRASDLAPLGYLSLVWSFASGAIIFGEPVAPRATVGAIAIAVGGIIALRSARSEEPSIQQTSVDYGDPADLAPSSLSTGSAEGWERRA